MKPLPMPMSWEKQTHCGFCFNREQGKHGEIKREWSQDWQQFIPVCRKHSFDLCGSTERQATGRE